MNLPTPTPDEVEEFREIYKRDFGIDLSDVDALEAATRTLRLFCLATYRSPHIRNDLPEASSPLESSDSTPLTD